MMCEVCGRPMSVMETRETRIGIRRRRECSKGHRVTTMEVPVDIKPGMVVNKVNFELTYPRTK